MGSSAQVSPAGATPEFLAAFRTAADAEATMSFDRFMALALYHPHVGYYRRDRARVGYGPGTDFFTATTSGPIFGELIAAACAKLLGPADPHEHTFIEIGAEPGGGVLTGVAHPFGSSRTIRLGEPIELSGPCVVFSNELFDAQPFSRYVRRDGQWREIAVRLDGDTLREVERPTLPSTALPAIDHDGYHFDAPHEAAALAAELARQAWSGLFVAFDYGKSLRELSEATPAGTARAYHLHTQSNDLLSRPGEQDLTCHVCWDWLSDALQQNGFASPVIESQEAFLIRHAGEAIAAISASEASRASQRKLALLQLLHPAHLGQKFQVLHARRD